MNQGRIFFRADGHQGMGLGHVVRSIALAEMLKDDFEIIFATRRPLRSLRRQIQALEVQLLELSWPENDLEEASALCDHYLEEEDIVVLDGYHFSTAYQKQVKHKGCRLIAIDDIHAYPFLADVVINHALGIEKKDYQVAPYTSLKLGTKYSLLRHAIRAAEKRKPSAFPEGPLLLCCGGADPQNDSLRLLRLLAAMNMNKPVHLVLGAAYAYHTELDAFLRQEEDLKVTIHEDLSATALVNLFQKCPIAILPPSTIAYEYLNIGGLLFLEVIADNQRRMFESFVKYGLAKPFSAFQAQPNIETHQWQMLLQRQATYFDGQQQARFKQIFKELTVTTVV